ncbi:Fic family protein [Candidatus Uhrbacteria bacterium]|nr:Fic family protein [Candidatus Uhrbacteria bacterium]
MSRDLLNEIDELFARYQQRRPLPDDERAALQEKLRLEWTYHSNALEGNSLTLGETAFYLREGLTSEGKPLVDFLEARNHAEAVDRLHSMVNRERPITESFIKELNALLHRGITERPAKGAGGQTFMRTIHPGEYKREPNHVLTLTGDIHRYVEPLRVHDEMERLIAMIGANEEKVHAVELAARVHYEMVRIHPFDDCNGRGARLFMNLLLMRAGYPPIVIRTEERRRYLETLEAADRGDDAPFSLFIAEHVRDAIRAAI